MVSEPLVTHLAVRGCQEAQFVSESRSIRLRHTFAVPLRQFEASDALKFRALVSNLIDLFIKDTLSHQWIWHQKVNATSDVWPL